MYSNCLFTLRVKLLQRRTIISTKCLVFLIGEDDYDDEHDGNDDDDGDKNIYLNKHLAIVMEDGG